MRSNPQQTGMFCFYIERGLNVHPSKNRINTKVSNFNTLYQNCSPKMAYPYKKDFFRRICVRDLNSRNFYKALSSVLIILSVMRN